MKKFILVLGITLFFVSGLVLFGASAKEKEDPRLTYPEYSKSYTAQMEALAASAEELERLWITFNEEELQIKLTEAGTRLDSEEISRIGRRFSELKDEKKWLDENSPHIVFTMAQ